MSELPESWTAIALSDAVINITITDKKIPQKEYLSEGAYPVFDQGQDYIGGYSDNKEKLVNCELPVLVFGDHTRVVKFVNQPFAPGADGIKVLQPQHFYNPRLLEYFTRHIATHLTNHGYARHYQHLVKSLIPLPPENEQNRIVAKIEELFSELDKGIENLKTAREQLKVYRQALLKHAFEGKLTAQWRAENQDKLETTDTLQECIQQERAQRYQQQLADWQTNGGSKPKAPKILPPLTAEELAELPELPAGWGWVRVADIGDVETGTTPPKNNPKNYGNEYPFFKPTDLEAGSNVRVAREYLSKQGLSHSRFLPANSTLVTCIGATIGKVGITRIDGASNQQINSIIPSDCVLPDFTYYQASGPIFQDAVKSNASSTTLPILNKSKFEMLVMAVCSFSEQQMVVLEVESKLSEIDQLDQTITTALQQTEALRQSILKKAFSGQLVPQDTHDEPASALLARIKAERADTALKTRRKTT